MVLEKKKIKKIKKQSGGLLKNQNEFNYVFGDRTPKKISLLEKLSSSPLATIFRFGPKKNWNTIIKNTSNRILQEPARLNFIKEIKELLLSSEYRKNVPVFYGNQLYSNKRNGYNEYICRKILGRLGVISSKRRIFIINPFAEFVNRITIFCIHKKYEFKKIKLFDLLNKLLKLDDFIGFPEIAYLPYKTRFYIIKDKTGIEEVITPLLEKNYSRRNLVSGCSLMMTAEIREENLPSQQDIIELYNILEDDHLLLEYYYELKNKTKYNQIYKNSKSLQNDYFEGICILLLKLNQFKNNLNQLNVLMNINKTLIESNNPVFKQQQNARQQIISNTLKEILSLIPKNQQLQQLYNYVKSKLNQPNLNLLEVSTQLIQEITTLLKSYQKFLSFLETKPIEKSAILEILQ